MKHGQTSEEGLRVQGHWVLVQVKKLPPPPFLLPTYYSEWLLGLFPFHFDGAGSRTRTLIHAKQTFYHQLHLEP